MPQLPAPLEQPLGRQPIPITNLPMNHANQSIAFNSGCPINSNSGAPLATTDISPGGQNTGVESQAIARNGHSNFHVPSPSTRATFQQNEMPSGLRSGAVASHLYLISF